MPDDALQTDRTAHRLDQTLGQSKAEASALHSRLLGAEALEWREQAGNFLLRNARAVVGHRHSDQLLVADLEQNADMAAARCVFHSVGHKIEQHLFEALPIGNASNK